MECPFLHRDQINSAILIHHLTVHGAHCSSCFSKHLPLLWKNASKLRPVAALGSAEPSGMLTGPAGPGGAVGPSAEGGGAGSMGWLCAGAAPSAGLSPAAGAVLQAAGGPPGAMVPGVGSAVPFICRDAEKLPRLRRRKHAIPQICTLTELQCQWTCCVGPTRV